MHPEPDEPTEGEAQVTAPTVPADPVPSATSAPAESTESWRRRADELAGVARKQAEFADELLAENRLLRTGEVREAVAPIVRGLARLADEIAQIRTADGAPTTTDLAHIDARVHELLHDAGVVPVSPDAGDPFDVTLHEAAGSVPTEDPTLDRTVLAVRRPGLRRDDGRLLRPALVVVQRFETHPHEGPAA